MVLGGAFSGWFWKVAFSGLAKEKALGEPCSWLGTGGRWEVLSVMSFVCVSLPGGVPVVDPPRGSPPVWCQQGRHLFAESGRLSLGYFFPLSFLQTH